jgi:hypothetical protein
MLIPKKLLLFVAVAGFCYLYLAPKRVAWFNGMMKKARLEAGGDREEASKDAVQERILKDVCPMADLEEYKPGAWSEFTAEDTVSVAITHDFFCDGQARKYLFRLRYGQVTEIIDLR